jgi:hypothetical protein
MAWNDEPDHPFAGIVEKLRRADENIFNLDSEIALFFKEGDYSVMPNQDGEMFLKAIEYHKNRAIPPRFNVLAGEIIHHLRSCFDHIVWHFSVNPVKNIRKIEFPVFDKAPVNHDSRKLFAGKLEGIADPNVISLIERLQPHHAAEPLDDPLWIIHDLDIVDKHRELLNSSPTGTVNFPVEMEPILESYQRAHPELNSVQVAHHFQSDGTLTPYISFRNFGGRKIQPVIPGLAQLFNYTFKTVSDFAVL